MRNPIARWLGVLILLCSGAVVSGEESNTPDKVGVFYRVDGEGYVEMPRTMGKKKTAMLITANSKLRMQFSGKTSENTINHEPTPEFAILWPSGDTNKLLLYPLSVKRKTREAVIGTGGGIHGESSTGAETIPLDVKLAGDSLFRLAPSQPLQPGEYALGVLGANEYFCFTVL